MNPLRLARLVVPWPALLAMTVVMAVVEYAVLASQWDVMRSWASVVEAADGAWLVLGILVVGCAAAVSIQPWRDRELTAALPDSGARTVAVRGVVVGLVAAAVHVLTVVGLVLWGWAVGLPGQPRLWPVLGVLVGLVACALFGTAVARTGVGLLSPLLAMGLFVSLVFGLRALGGVDLIDLGGVSVVLVGLAPDTQVVLLRAAWLAGAGAVAWWLAARGRTALRRVPFLVLVLGTVALAITTVREAEAGFVRTPVVWACAPGPPEVCVAAEFEDRLADYASAVSGMAPAAQQVGLPEPRDGYRQTAGIRPGAGSFNVDPDVNAMQMAFDFVQFTLPCSVDWELEDLARAEQIAAFMASQVGGPVPPDVRMPDLAEARQSLGSLRCDQ